MLSPNFLKRGMNLISPNASFYKTQAAFGWSRFFYVCPSRIFVRPPSKKKLSPNENFKQFVISAPWTFSLTFKWDTFVHPEFLFVRHLKKKLLLNENLKGPVHFLGRKDKRKFWFGECGHIVDKRMSFGFCKNSHLGMLTAPSCSSNAMS